MVAEIICVGTEILLGNIVNTNAAFLAERLAFLGISTYYQTVVGDNEQRLLSTIELARTRADIIILSGGLGPTEDDLTKETAARAFNKTQVFDEKAKENIAERLTARNLRLTENNWKQAMVPEGSLVLYNENGTAPGIIMEEEGKTVILLPGPPSELEPMFDHQVMPYLEKKEDHVIYSQMVKMCGVSESAVETDIKDLIKSDNPTVATYAKLGEVHVRVTAMGEDEKSARKLVKPVVKELKARFGGSIYTTDADVTLEDSVVELLAKNDLTVTTAESCTGGLLAGRIVNVPGSSDIFKQGFITYSNKAKRHYLSVKRSTLDKYGAVSEQTVKEMVKGGCANTKADVCVAVSGIAGPGGGTEEKPVGLVYIGCNVCGRIKVVKCNFSGSRNKVRESAVSSALTLLRRCILEYYSEKNFS